MTKDRLEDGEVAGLLQEDAGETGGANPMLKRLAVALSASVVVTQPYFAFAQPTENTETRMPPETVLKLKQWLDTSEDDGWVREPICLAILVRDGGYCQTITFHKYLPQTTPYSRIWTRNEYFEPHQFNGQKYKSDVWLMEIDCANKRSRPIQVTAYPDSNMGGLAFSPPANKDWFYAVPGSTGETEVSLACSEEFRKNFTIGEWKTKLGGQKK